jgi:hypothetical protein
MQQLSTHCSARGYATESDLPAFPPTGRALLRLLPRARRQAQHAEQKSSVRALPGGALPRIARDPFARPRAFDDAAESEGTDRLRGVPLTAMRASDQQSARACFMFVGRVPRLSHLGLFGTSHTQLHSGVLSRIGLCARHAPYVRDAHPCDVADRCPIHDLHLPAASPSHRSVVRWRSQKPPKGVYKGKGGERCSVIDGPE